MSLKQMQALEQGLKQEPPCKTGSQCTTECMECAEQEPVIDKSAAIRIATSLGWTPKREWQGLTDDEIKQIEETTTCEGNESWLRNLTRNIEAKLKEKNA